MNILIQSEGETITIPVDSVTDALEKIADNDLVRTGDFALISIVKGDDD